MDLPKRKQIRLTYYDYSQSGMYCITICTHERKKLLSRIEIMEETEPHSGQKYATPRVKLLQHGNIAEKYILQLGAFYDNINIDKYIIMPDHIHLLVCIQGDCAKNDGPNRNSVLSKFVSTLKRFCNKEYGCNIWQARYYDHIIRNQSDYNQVWDYIDQNPMKWILKHGDLPD